jgi:hypothetical protein
VLNFEAIRNEKMTFNELIADLTCDDLRDLTNEMIDAITDLIADCIDADVIFEPHDPDAHDPYAAKPEDVDLAWNLGHVVAHTTASSEEAAALARGVEYHGRSRYETPWETMRTIASCCQRLEESRRMRLSSLEMWPSEPHLDNIYRPWPGAPEVDAIGRLVLGLMHDDGHIGQIVEIVRQAKAARA